MVPSFLSLGWVRAKGGAVSRERAVSTLQTHVPLGVWL